MKKKRYSEEQIIAIVKRREAARAAGKAGRRIRSSGASKLSVFFGVPDGIRTRVIAVKGRCPRPG